MFDVLRRPRCRVQKHCSSAARQERFSGKACCGARACCATTAFAQGLPACGRRLLTLRRFCRCDWELSQAVPIPPVRGRTILTTAAQRTRRSAREVQARSITFQGIERQPCSQATLQLRVCIGESHASCMHGITKGVLTERKGICTQHRGDGVHPCTRRTPGDSLCDHAGVRLGRTAADNFGDRCVRSAKPVKLWDPEMPRVKHVYTRATCMYRSAEGSDVAERHSTPQHAKAFAYCDRLLSVVLPASSASSAIKTRVLRLQVRLACVDTRTERRTTNVIARVATSVLLQNRCCEHNNTSSESCGRAVQTAEQGMFLRGHR